MRNLHHLVESRLEAPALAWNVLAYYWGMSAFGLGPAYKDYMQSDAAKMDLAWNAASNEALNVMAGLRRSLTIKERFDRAANFYAYCAAQGNRHAINPPFDAPPTVDELVQSRMRMENKSSSPDKLIEASNESILGDDPKLLKLWNRGGEEKREQRSREYNQRVLDTLNYVASEMQSLYSITSDQLNETGFLAEGTTGQLYNVTADMMDEAMPEEVQDKKFGECYLQPSPSKAPELILSGIYGAYYTMGHNLSLAMFDEESKSRLSSAYHATLRTWRQLHDISKENQ